MLALQILTGLLLATGTVLLLVFLRTLDQLSDARPVAQPRPAAAQRSVPAPPPAPAPAAPRHDETWIGRAA